MKIEVVHLSRNVQGHVMKDGTTRVLVNSSHLQECIDVINATVDSGAIVSHFHGYHNSHDVNFLIRCPHLTHLTLEDSFADILAVGRLSLLRSMSLHPALVLHDFAAFSKLRQLTAGYHSLLSGLNHCKQLTNLKLRQIMFDDLSDLPMVINLQSLSLVNGQLQRLTGIEQFPHLERLQLSYLSKLQDLSALRYVPKLHTLEIFSARNVIDLSAIRSLPSLKNLKLFAVDALPSLDFILDLPDLETFSFVDVNVENGDMSPLTNHPKLKRADFIDQPHFSLSASEVRQQLNSPL